MKNIFSNKVALNLCILYILKKNMNINFKNIKKINYHNFSNKKNVYKINQS